MNYRNAFENCFEWIDSHLKENITVDEMAREMGYSVYHFCRIFYLYQGLTPMEYVLSRRLQAAISELNKGKKIIDIAFEYGFETPSGFTKAIKMKYGKTPSQLKRDIISSDPLSTIHTQIIHTEIKEMKGFDICGYSIKVDFNSANYLEGMIAYWTEFDDNEIEKQLYDSIDPNKHGEIGVLIRDANDSAIHRYLLGVMGNKKAQSDQWLDYHISGGKYVIVTTPPVDMTLGDNELAFIVKKVWRYIFEQWFETVEFQFDETREAFEYYDERCHYRKDAVMNIYIPIK